MRLLALALAAAALAHAAPAGAAPSLTLNGVSIDGVTDQKFENATVVIDGAGNIHIQARGYAVKGDQVVPPAASPAARNGASAGGAAPAVASSGSGAAASGRLGRRYFLATEQTQPDGTQFDVEVFINAKWIRVLRSTEPQAVVEVTRYLQPGTNRVTLASTKKLAGAERRFYTRDVSLRVVIGEGNVGGDHVMIDEPLVLMTRTAAEVDDKTEEYTFEAR